MRCLARAQHHVLMKVGVSGYMTPRLCRVFCERHAVKVPQVTEALSAVGLETKDFSLSVSPHTDSLVDCLPLPYAAALKHNGSQHHSW